MEVTIDREYEFVPEWNGNKSDGKPIVFKMRFLSTGERDKFMKYKFTSDGNVNLEPDRQGMFVAAVAGITNLNVNGEGVTKARDMLERPGLDALFTEVVTNVMSQNIKDNLKN